MRVDRSPQVGHDVDVAIGHDLLHMRTPSTPPPVIGIKFGRQGSPDQKALAPTQIIKLTAGGEALREYDGILQVGMTLTKIQGVLLMNQIGYSYRRNSWVGNLIRDSDRPLVLTFQRASSTADQPSL